MFFGGREKTDLTPFYNDVGVYSNECEGKTGSANCYVVVILWLQADLRYNGLSRVEFMCDKNSTQSRETGGALSADLATSGPRE